MYARDTSAAKKDFAEEAKIEQEEEEEEKQRKIEKLPKDKQMMEPKMQGKKRFKNKNEDEDPLLYQQALEMSKHGGLEIPVFNYDQQMAPNPKNLNISSGSIGVNRVQAIGANGKPLTRVSYDVNEIYELLKDCAANAKASEERKQQELNDKIELEWSRYEERTPPSQRYNIDGVAITKETFYENPYSCPAGICSKRFKTYDEAAKHAQSYHRLAVSRSINV